VRHTCRLGDVRIFAGLYHAVLGSKVDGHRRVAGRRQGHPEGQVCLTATSCWTSEGSRYTINAVSGDIHFPSPQVSLRGGSSAHETDNPDGPGCAAHGWMQQEKRVHSPLTHSAAEGQGSKNSLLRRKGTGTFWQQGRGGGPGPDRGAERR